jgi:hypothetical protein
MKEINSFFEFFEYNSLLYSFVDILPHHSENDPSSGLGLCNRG